ncbi:hypothetical protein LG272_10915 [Pseudidiomarina marina]|uniref:hypothetical protein n=1 Tax=Pseudidiomarina marina TaxID=502366 RepID=UPI00384FC21A
MSAAKKWALWGLVGVPVGALLLLFTLGMLKDFGLLPERRPWHASAAETPSGADSEVGVAAGAAAPDALGDKEAPTPMGAYVAQHWTDAWLRTYDLVLQATSGDKTSEVRLREILAHCPSMDVCKTPEHAFSPINDALADFITAQYLLGSYYLQRAEATGDTKAGDYAFQYLNIATLYKHPLGAFAYAQLRERGKYTEKDLNNAYAFYFESGQAGYLQGAIRAANVASNAKSWGYARNAFMLALQYPLNDSQRAMYEQDLRSVERAALNESLVTAEELPRTIRLF